MKYKLLPRGNSAAISNTQRIQKLCMDHLIKNQTLAKTRQLRRPKQLTSLRRLKLPSDHLMILLMMTMTSSQKRNQNQSLKSHELISSLQHVKCCMMMVYDMMVQFVGLSTVKQNVCGNTRFLFLMGRQLSSFLMPKSHELISSLQHVKCFMMMV